MKDITGERTQETLEEGLGTPVFKTFVANRVEPGNLCGVNKGNTPKAKGPLAKEPNIPGTP